MNMNRRGLLLGAGSLLLSPAVVRAQALMPVSNRHIPVLVVLETVRVNPHPYPFPPMLIRRPLWVHRSELITKAGQDRLMARAVALGEPWHDARAGHYIASSYGVGDAFPPEEQKMLEECAYLKNIIIDGLNGGRPRFFPNRLLKRYSDAASERHTAQRMAAGLAGDGSRQSAGRAELHHDGCMIMSAKLPAIR